jgi:hypothetical protein
MNESLTSLALEIEPLEAVEAPLSDLAVIGLVFAAGVAVGIVIGFT